MKYQIINCFVCMLLLVNHFAYGQCICPDVVHNMSCPLDFDPVCGCDNNVYSNECHARAAGVKKYKMGECGSTTGDWIYSVCNNGNTVMEDCSCEPEISCGDHPDYAPLMALYNSTGGPFWNDNTGWVDGVEGTNCDPCNGWYGVDCNGNGRVVCLDLDGFEDCNQFASGGNGLVGFIPFEIGELDNLEFLSFSDNELSEGIPGSIGQLTNLSVLHLQNNRLTNAIPETIGGMQNLVEIYLYNNSLNSSIPTSIGDLSQLRRLFLYNNDLTGSIPSEIGNLSNLEVLYLSWNELTGPIPSEIGNLNNLKDLYLYDNALSGSIPSFNSNVVLRRFYCSENNLSGCYPDQFLCNLEFTPDKNGVYIYNGDSISYFNEDGYNISNNPLLPWEGNYQEYCGTNGGIDVQIGAPCVEDDNNGQIDEMCNCVASEHCGSHPDYAPLMALYNSTNGPNWTYNNGWADGAAGTNCDPCNGWHGVSCDENDRVTCLDLDGNPSCSGYFTNGNNLSGTLPPELGSLNQLRGLFLTDNQLTGNIPHEIGNLTQLHELHLSNNQLTGNIPAELGNLNLLEWLSLSQNQLSGNIPSELGNLTQLMVLNLLNNQLSGHIPPELVNLNQLIGINLSNNQLTGNIPTELGNLNLLEWLSLSQNQLSGNIPPELGNLNLLEGLRLYDNQLTGNIPNELANLNQLSYLYLNDNQLNGCIPAALKEFICNLDLKDLSNNPLLPWQGNTDSLCMNDVQAQIGAPCVSNGFTGNIDADCNCIPSDACGAHLDYAPLMALYNSTNGPNWSDNTGWADGAASTNCDPCNGWYGVTCENSRVVQVQLVGDGLVGVIPPELGSLNQLESLSLTSNQLTGHIPFELGNLNQLIWLNLGDNQLNGSIPPEFGNLNQLESLSLTSNQLTGHIPLEIGSLSKLTWLSLDDNKLTGNIPPELGNLNNLRHLFLHKNQLWGNIPPELENLGLLEWFFLYNNQLSGCIPTGLKEVICNIEIKNLSNNQLLPWQGNTDSLCMNDVQNQIGAPCVSNGFTGNIEADCSCMPSNACGAHLDYSSLMALYNNTDGDNWSDKSGWADGAAGTNCDPCSGWYGIDCDDNGRVSRLALSFNQLSGSIPVEIGDLSHLEYLSLDGNQLVGSIPEAIGNLVRLEHFSSGSNQLSGNIPSELGNLVLLKSLYLDNNQLIGSIPIALGGLIQLKTLILSENQLSGSIPDTISNLTHLERLYLNDNQISGNLPPGLSALDSLYGLAINNNQLSGCISDELNTYICNIGYNDLSGNPLLPWQGNTDSLCMNDAQDQMGAPCEFNGINGQIDEMCQCVTIDTCGSHPDYAPLMALYNSTNGDNWTDNTGWADGAAGTSCDPCNGWYGVDCDHNGRVSRLTLSFNQLNGNIPLELGNLNQLTTLGLGDNQLIGNIPSELGNLNQLLALNLYENQLTGSIPSELGNLSQLAYLFLFGNQLTGNIPSELGNLNQLIELRLSNNQLKGNIPSELGNLNQLGALSLSGNQLSGSIPAELSSLNQLTQLYLYDNQLSGCIPPTIKEFICNIQNKDLSNNPQLPWQGNTDSLCMNDFQAQIGAPCEINGINGQIDEMCECISADTCGSHPDYAPLMALYNSTNGDNWTDNTGWADGVSGINCNPCNGWYGVTCNANGRVTCLDLDGEEDCSAEGDLGNNLLGSIPEAIGLVNELESIFFAKNKLSNSIPSEIGDLNKLTHINLEDNELTGTIPESITNLSSLLLLDISDNQLVGEIPSNIGNLINLQDFSLEGNAIEGVIPNSLSSLLALNRLYLYDNKLEGCIDSSLKTTLCNINQVNISSNFQLPWRGNIDSICVRSVQDQIGASCSINGQIGIIDGDCNCIPIDTCGTHPDYAPLMALYNSTNGPSWTDNTGWADGAEGTNCNPCNGWYGVICNGDGRVTCLDLDGNPNCSFISSNGNNLSGTLPTELANLNQLTGLYLSVNQLTGNIPSELGSLSQLKGLGLLNNQLTGNIPPEFGSLNQLISLYLFRNQLTGNLPSELGNLSQLKELLLSNNQLTGNIPPELANLNQLKELGLSSNQLTGNIPSELGNLSQLNELHLLNNQLMGNIPPELGNLNQLKRLSLGSNQLTGNIPSELGNLSQLSQLDLFNNQLTGNIPFELGSLNLLKELGLSNNQLTGNVPSELGNLTQLSQLGLSNNQLTGCIPAGFKEVICNADFQDLSNNPLLPWQGNTDSLCSNEVQAQIGAPCLINNTIGLIDEMCECINTDACGSHPDYTPLMALYNSTNGASWTNNTGWADGAAGTNCDPCNGWYGVTCNANGRVTCLDLDGSPNCSLFSSNGNNLSGTLPTELGSLNQLRGLYLSKNQLTGSIPPELGNLSQLKEFSLSNNQLTGNIPPEIGNLNQLKALSLSVNQLTGNIPSELGNLSQLKNLSLFLNELTGNLPPELGNLSQLEGLLLFNNQLMGNIPPELANLNQLKTLHLSNNQLSGNISPELGNLSQLEALQMFNNQFSGNIPPELGNLSQLKWFYLGDNQLTGNIPPGLGNLNQLITLSLSNNQLSGNIPPELGNLSQLKWLYLGNNEFNGSVSELFNELDSIQVVYLDNNKLTGNLPSFDNAQSLKSVYLSDNNFSGCYPNKVFCEMTFVAERNGFYESNGETIYYYNEDGYNLTNNPLLPWDGNYQNYCNTGGDLNSQVGAPCNRSINTGSIEVILEDCSCGLACANLIQDSIVISIGDSYDINLLDNDIVPDSFSTQLVSIPELLNNVNYTDFGVLQFEISEDFFEPLELIYEVCTADCECKQMSLFIINEELEEIVPTNVFTPNGDGNNDQLRFTQRDIIPDSELWIYNRWGDRIFHMKDYDNSWTADGYPSGIYYYVLEVRGNVLKKTLTIVR